MIVSHELTGGGIRGVRGIIINSNNFRLSDLTLHTTIRAVGRFENSVMPVIVGVYNLLNLVG